MKAVVVTVLVTLLACACIVPAQAKQPIDFIWNEFWSAEGLALLGGLMGLSVGTTVDKYCDFSYGSFHSNCELATLIWMNGRTIGAIAGVWIAGSSSGVQGNIWGVVLVPGLGLMTALLSSYAEAWNLPGPIAQLMSIYYYPFVPAAFATIGYNIGAMMKADSSQAKPSSWGLDMPLFSFEF